MPAMPVNLHSQREATAGLQRLPSNPLGYVGQQHRVLSAVRHGSTQQWSSAVHCYVFLGPR
jgi:hypothetical protein